MHDLDKFWMEKAIDAAAAAEKLGEIPIGACLIGENGEFICAAGNRTITDSDPTAHAEILVLRRAAQLVKNYRLTGSILYTTVEPCAMCAGALVNARVKRLVYGTRDERFGAVETVFRICDSDRLNHRIEITAGVSADECRRLMQDFFRKKREIQKNKNNNADAT